VARVGLLRGAGKLRLMRPWPVCWIGGPDGRGLNALLFRMPKQLNGTPGKKPPAPSVKVRLGRKALRKPRQTDEAETGRQRKSVPACRGNALDSVPCLFLAWKYGQG